MVLARVPKSVRALTEVFLAELETTLGDRFVGMFQYGAAFFPPSPVSDFDAHVVVRDPFTDDDRTRVWAMIERLRSVPGGDDMDVWYVTADSLRSVDPPQTELKPGFRDKSWALHRAHVHAGRFVHVKGPDPREIVPLPMWSELDAALQGELDYVGEHLDDAPAFGVLNLCRILYSYETRDVVVGKLQAAMWAIAYLDLERHELIRDAIDAYARETYAIDEDITAFFDEMSARIAEARSLSWV